MKKIENFKCLIQDINSELESKKINAENVVSISTMNDGAYSTKVIVFYIESSNVL